MVASKGKPYLMCRDLYISFVKAGLTDAASTVEFSARIMGLVDVERTLDDSRSVPMKVNYDLSLTLECLQYMYTGKYHPYIRANFLSYFGELSDYKPAKRLDKVTRCVVDVLKRHELEHLFVYFAPFATVCVDMAYHLYKDEYREVLDSLYKQFRDESE